MGYIPKSESKSDKLLSIETQLCCRKEIGFVNVECYRKWLEMALLVDIKSDHNAHSNLGSSRNMFNKVFIRESNMARQRIVEISYI